MASILLEEMMSCAQCGHDTLHRKNAKKMSWILHIILSVVTMGGWLIIWGLLFLWHIINKTGTALANSWTCSNCGNKKLIAL